MKIKMFLKSLALAGAALSGAWSGSAVACASEPMLSSVCVMAWSRGVAFNNTYVLAAGQQMSISANPALFSLLGATYGSTDGGRTNFMLPDLRGRVVVGAGASTVPGVGTYTPGQVGGNVGVTLTSAQLPVHAHNVTGITAVVGLGTLKADTALTGLSATASLTGVSGSVKGSDLTFNVSTAPNAETSTPSTSTLLAPTSATARIYSASSTATTAMSNKSIGGTAAVTFTGNPSVSISGTPSTTLSGAPSITLGGATAPAGGSAAVDVRQPYQALYYYIATQGLYPSQD